MPKDSSAKIERKIGFRGGENVYLALRMYDADKRPFYITVAKAQLILDHAEDLRKFVEEFGNPKRRIKHGE